MFAIAAQVSLEAWPAIFWSIVPWIWNLIWAFIWNLAWGGIDLTDTFSDTEVLLDMLQFAWRVDPNYRMDKTWIDNVLAWLWLIPWATIVIKWAKLSKFLWKLPKEEVVEWIKWGLLILKKSMDLFRIKNLPDLLKILEIKDFDPFSPNYEDLLKIMEAAKYNREILEFPDVQRALRLKIAENHPSIPLLSRLKKLDSLSSIAFAKVKKLNDSYNQKFSDDVLALFKKKVQEQFDWFDPILNWHKIFSTAWDKLPPKADLNRIMQEAFDETLINEINRIQEIITNLTKKTKLTSKESEQLKESQDALGKLNVLSNPIEILTDTRIIEWTSQTDILYDIALQWLDIERQLSWNRSNLPEVFNMENEIARRYSDTTINITATRKIKIDTWRSIWNFERETILVNQTFRIRNWVLIRSYTYNWENYRDSFNIIEWGRPSIDIITMVRKGDLPKDFVLYWDIKKLLDSYVANLEYIPSFWNIGHNWEIVPNNLITLYNNLWKKSDIHALTRLLRESYKGWVSKDELYRLASESKWTLMFIDIIWMWSVNMRNIWRVINEYLNELSKLEKMWLSEVEFKKQKLELHKKMLFESWGDMTWNFKELIIQMWNLRKIYGDFYFSIWWDELKILVPNKNVWTELSDRILNILQELNIWWRVAYTEYSKWAWKWSELLAGIDSLTIYSKKIESRLNWILKSLEVRFINNEIDSDQYDYLCEMIYSLGKFIVYKDWNTAMIKFLDNPFNVNTVQLREIVDMRTGLLVEDSRLINLLEELWLWRVSKKKLKKAA